MKFSTFSMFRYNAVVWYSLAKQILKQNIPKAKGKHHVFASSSFTRENNKHWNCKWNENEWLLLRLGRTWTWTGGRVIKQGWKTIVTCFATPFERKTFSQMKIPYEAKDAEHDGVYKEKENGRNKNMHFNWQNNMAHSHNLTLLLSVRPSVSFLILVNVSKTVCYYSLKRKRRITWKLQEEEKHYMTMAFL